MRLCLAVLGLAAAGLFAPASRAAPIDDLARAYVEAVDRADAAAIDGFRRRMTPAFAKSAPDAAVVGFFEDQHRVSGGVELIGVRLRPGAPAIAELALRDRVYGGVQGVELVLEPGPQPQVANFDLVPAPAWAVRPAPPITEAELAARTAALVQKGCAAGVFSGAVLLAAGDEVLTERACGEASRRHHAPMTAGTRINIGSMDKMFTTVAAMQLAEAGRLELDAPVGRYLDESWLARDVAARVTVWQLMTHTHGLAPDVMTALHDKARHRLRRLADFKPLVRRAQPAFEPGSRFEYSNTGMLLLGAIVAQVSGQDYYDYVREHVFAPAGMAATGSFAADDPVENLAVGYYPAPDSPYGWRENAMGYLLRGIPAGGGYSTVGDLHRFARALQTGRLVSRAALARLWAGRSPENYGAGFEVNQGAVGKTVGHSGLYAGVSARMRLYLDRGYVLVVLSNLDRGAPPLVDAIEGEILRAPKGN